MAMAMLWLYYNNLLSIVIILCDVAYLIMACATWPTATSKSDMSKMAIQRGYVLRLTVPILCI